MKSRVAAANSDNKILRNKINNLENELKEARTKKVNVYSDCCSLFEKNYSRVSNCYTFLIFFL